MGDSQVVLDDLARARQRQSVRVRVWGNDDPLLPKTAMTLVQMGERLCRTPQAFKA